MREKISILREKFDSEATLGQVYDYKKNLFDIIRHLLAVCVIIFHAYILFLGINGRSDFITRFLKVTSMGEVAVASFFVISGFLITQSMLNSKSYLNYFFKRVLRIYPAFVVAILLCAFVVGPMVTKLDFNNYLHSGVKDYVLNNLNLFGNSNYCISDVFNTNPYPNGINGSIWTIKHEVMAYVIVAILSFFGLLKHRKMSLVFTIALFVLVLIKPVIDFGKINLVIGVINEYKAFTNLLFYFMVGCLFYLYKDKIIVSFKLFLLACLTLIGGIIINNADVALFITLPYIIIYLSMLKPRFDIKKIGDFSYGLYVYAFPVQQLLVYYLRNSLNIYSYIALSILGTLAIAIPSWYFIEKPFLNLKKKVVKRDNRT